MTAAKKKAEPDNEGVRSIPLDYILESPTNQRRTFRDLDELAATIKNHGVLQPVLVRPLLTDASFELVFGARRFRASKLAGLQDIPATVRELTDAQALELQLIENSKRDDVHPLEEADGYRELHEQHRYPIAEIAAKVAKSEQYVSQRLRLCALSEKARESFMAGTLSTGTALLVARLASTAHQDRAVERIRGARDEDEAPLTVREAARVIQREFLLKLVSAPFDTSDASLVPDAPACSSCTQNSGNQRALFGELEVEDEGDLCTDKVCFAAKSEAGWVKRKAAAKEAGQKVLSAKEVKELFPYGHLKYDAGYIDLAMEEYSDGKRRTNKERLGKVDVPIVVARDPDGRIRELVAKEDFAKATKAAPTPKAKEKAKEDKAARKVELEKERAERAKREADLVELVTAAENAEDSEHLWRAIAAAVAHWMWSEHRKAASKRRGIETDLREHALTLTAGGARGLVVELLALATRDGMVHNDSELRAALLGAPAKKKEAPAKKAEPAKKASKKPAAAPAKKPAPAKKKASK